MTVVWLLIPGGCWVLWTDFERRRLMMAGKYGVCSWKIMTGVFHLCLSLFRYLQLLRAGPDILSLTQIPHQSQCWDLYHQCYYQWHLLLISCSTSSKGSLFSHLYSSSYLLSPLCAHCSLWSPPAPSLSPPPRCPTSPTICPTCAPYLSQSYTDTGCPKLFDTLSSRLQT